MAFSVVKENWKTLTYRAEGTLQARAGRCRNDAGGHLQLEPGWWAGGAAFLEVGLPFTLGPLTFTPEYGSEELSDPPYSGTRHKVRWLVEIPTRSAQYTRWYTLSDEWETGAQTDYEVNCDWWFNLTLHACDLYAEWAEGGDDDEIWKGRPGNGAELCRSQGVVLTAYYDTYSFDVDAGGATIYNVDEANLAAAAPVPLTGISVTHKLYPIGGLSLPAATWTQSVEYTSWNGTSDVQRTIQYIDMPHPESVDDEDIWRGSCTLGNGVCSETLTSDVGITGDSVYTLWAGPAFRDLCCKTEHPAADLRYMFDAERHSNQANWHIIGKDCHPAESVDEWGQHTYEWPVADTPDAKHVDLNAADADLSYGGAWVAYYVPLMLADNQPGEDSYRDTPNDVNDTGGTFVFGNAFLARWDASAEEWVSGLSSDTPTETAIGEPAHQNPELWPPSPGGTPPDDEPPWYDESLYVTSPELKVDDALQITVPAVGLEYADPLVFADVSGWDGTGCTVDTDAGGLKITTSQPNATAAITSAEGLAAQVWLNGRFARVHWQCNEADSDAVLNIGPHSWNLSGGAADTDNETVIDLLRPDNAAALYNVQSIIPYELPLALSRTLPDPWTHDGGTWDIPAGWGISRMTNVTLTCANGSAIYHFEKLSLLRKSEAEGGFAKLYVFPHQASWNDERSFSDFAIQSAGGDRYVYRKGLLVIDGAIVAELIAGWMYVSSDYNGDHYLQVYTKLDERIGLWPLRDYADIYNDPENADLATPGVSYSTDPGSDFMADYCYIWGLVPGVYTPNGSNVISVDLKLPVRYITYPQGLNGADLIDACLGRWRGMACGVAWTSDGEIAANAHVPVATPGASSGHETDTVVTTNALGWWSTEPLNTKDDGEFFSGEDLVSATLRNRMITIVKGEAVPPTATESDTVVDPLRGVLMVGYITNDGKLAVRRSADYGLTLGQPQVVSQAASPRRPCVFIRTGEARRLYGVAWDEAGTAKMALSGDGFATYEVSELMSDLTHVRIAVHPLSGVMLNAGWRSTDQKIVARRSVDNGVTWSDAAVVAAAPQQAFGLQPSPTARNIWCLTFADAAGNIVTYWSGDDGATWKLAA